jgi:hypothetical protein
LFDAKGYMRGEFIQTAFARVPELTSSLWEIYQEGLRQKLVNILKDKSSFDFSRANNLGKRKLAGWCKRWRLTDDWAVSGAMEHVYRWFSEDCKSSDGRSIEVATILPPVFKTQPFELCSLVWDPTELTKAAFKAKVRMILKCALHVYCEEIESLAIAKGYRRNIEIRQLNHFRWLVGYQVCAFSVEAMAKVLNVKPGAVRHGVHKLASQLDLRRRNSSDYQTASLDTIRHVLLD